MQYIWDVRTCDPDIDVIPFLNVKELYEFRMVGNQMPV